MEKNSHKLINLANKSFSEILTDGFKLFLQSYRTLIIPLALFQILLIVLNVLLLTDLSWQIDTIGINIPDLMEKFIQDESLTESELNTLIYFLFMTIVLLFLQNLIGAVVITIAMCSVSNYVFRRYMDEDVSFVKSFKSAFNKKIFLVILIIGIFLPLGAVLFYIPAIIIFGFFIFLIFTYNMEIDKSPISEARAIAKGAFWKIIGVFVVNILLILIIDYIFTLIIDFFIVNESTVPIINSWYNPLTRNFGMLILYNILYSIIDIFFAPLFICLLTVLFSSLKAKKELKIQYQEGYYPERELYQESYRILRQQPLDAMESEASTSFPEIGTQNRFYCPFCGTLIQSPKKYCPKCGESLKFFQINNEKE
ncbi:MAG: hypothetical protein ACFE9Q_13615 [Candidatus Hodarchaeota archaeon]